MVKAGEGSGECHSLLLQGSLAPGEGRYENNYAITTKRRSVALEYAVELMATDVGAEVGFLVVIVAIVARTGSQPGFEYHSFS